MREITYAEAIMEAFREEMRRDDRVFHICGNLGPLAGLVSEFGIERLRASPISEEAYVGAGIGAAGSGFRPIISPGMMTFAFTAMDQIVNQMAKIHYMFGGQAPFPLVFRASTGGGRSAAAQHSQSPHPMFMNLAGLKLVMPSNPYDAKGLMSGFRPIISPGMMTFAFTAMDQIVNQMAKIHYMFGGQASFPLVFRASTGGGRSAAAQHSQSPHPMFMNLAGLKLVMPSNPYDAKGLMKSAIRDNNPVVFFEDQIIAALPDRFPVPEEEYVVPIGEADVKREGSDVTVIAISKMVREALKAADELETEGISLEVVDPRTLVPMDTPAIRRSVRKTGRAVIVDEACITGSAAAEICAQIAEDPETFRALKSPPVRVCAPDVPIPYSPIMERYCLPDKDNVIAGVRRALQ